MQHGFATELDRFGPGREYAPPPIAAARRYCARLAGNHYENFNVVSLLLPRQLRPHFHAVYAYCRWADDLADETAGGDESLQLLAWWRAELDACYASRPRHPVMVALHETVSRFNIPPAPFLDLLTAFAQDQRVKRYATFDELLGYCRHSANPVGRLVLYLCRCFDEENTALSDEVCTGLQLANFWQDVDRDLDIGRVYLPEEDRRRFAYDDEDLARRRFTPAFAELLRFEVERTRAFFHRGLPLVERVPAGVRLDIDLFIRGGLAILARIEAEGYNVWRRRPALSKWQKAALVAGACWRRAAAL